MTPFDDLDDFVALRRLSNLRLSPTGERLVVAVQSLDAKKTGFVSALWEVDPAGVRPARRLTRSAPGESQPAFTVEGELLFTSARPDPESEGGDGKSEDPKPALWALPAQGEARAIVERPGGIAAFDTARADGRVVLVSSVAPGAKTTEEDAEARKYRKEKKVGAILHDFAPVRNWDQDLGPERPRLFATDIDGSGPHDLTPEPGWAYDDVSFDLVPDGSALVTTHAVAETGGDRRYDLVALDLAASGSGSEPSLRVLATDPEYDFSGPRVSPDGRFVVCERHRRPTPEQHWTVTFWLIDLASGEGRDLTPDLDLWPTGAQWSPDGRTVYFHADENGRHPVFAVAVESGAVRRLASDGAYTDLQVSPDGAALYALRAAVDSPPLPVRLSTELVDQTPVFLRGPDPAPEVPGTFTEVTAEAEDGTPLRAWLALPEDTSTPVPLVLWIHGGPYASWNGWLWRWVPWLLTVHGYAVLMPDPATSTGYGDAFVARGYGRWGSAPYTDLMRITDAAVARPDIDAERTAAMGGSFGGYMANWVAGHTDRFKAIVSHAGLWALDQFGPTTDFAASWFRELTLERSIENSPQRFADQITTPMLVIHGDRDYRVPIGEALRLWADLVTRHQGAPEEIPHRFLYFPTENHWILSPEHIKIWYRTILAFLAWHLLGGTWEPPEHV